MLRDLTNALKSLVEDEQGLANTASGIPTDRRGFSLRLVKSQKISTGMGKAMSKGFYPEEQIRFTISAATRQGKQLKELYNKYKKYKTNYLIKFESEDGAPFWDSETNGWVMSSVIYAEDEAELKRKLDSIKKRPEFERIIEIRKVKEWHHISGGGTNYLIDIKALEDAGFKIDKTNANKEFKG